MWADHLPALQVVVPLLAAPLCVVLGRGSLAWGLSTIVSFTCLGIAAALLDRVLSDGPVSYLLGSWAAPWGIEYRIDEVNAYVLLVVSGVSSAVLPFAARSVEQEIPADRVHLFYTCWMLALTGLLGIAITGDAFNVFVFLEISSLSSYVLISMGRERRALPAAFQYLVLGTIGATFILIGIGLLYQETGTLNMADLAVRLTGLERERTVVTAFAFLSVGIALKAAVYPIHLWLPNAYASAPSAVTAFLAGTATKVAVYLLLRVMLTVFGYGFVFETLSLGLVLLILGASGVLIPSAVALYQSDLKRLLAYSSVGQIGYMVLGVSYATTTGVTAALVHLFNHAIMKSALFLALGCVVYRVGSARLRDLDGLGRCMPWTMAAFVAAALSLIGVPLTCGFVSKWYLVLGAVEIGWWPAAVVVLGGSLLAFGYLWKVVEAAYFRERPAAEPVEEAPLDLLIPLWALVAANVYFGIDTDLTVGVAERAAVALLGGLR